MYTLKESIEKVCQKYNKVPKSVITKIIEEYHKDMIETMLETGHIYISPDIRVDVVPITPRRYVLRGQEYRSTRFYKLKASASDKLYNMISKDFDSFREDI